MKAVSRPFEPRYVVLKPLTASVEMVSLESSRKPMMAAHMQEMKLIWLFLGRSRF